ncbi:MAG: DUF1592 domain-containing protein [Planctomycetaceae bacterium]|nr:DUF1592 domain-containing protein [Planctomycetaceae bacterium]
MLSCRTIAAACVLALVFHGRLSAAEGLPADFASLEQAYVSEIRPLIARYCDECHSGDTIEGQVDLGSIPGFADVRRSPETWQRVLDMIRNQTMPPEGATPLEFDDRRALLSWLRRYLPQEAALLDGDAGHVVLRRLNNAEYTNTIRDLTGVATLDPAREFPADSAAGEGFTNTGAALVMSPALVSKYFDAAKDVARHAVLLPDGFRFSSSADRRDWTEEALARIRHVYRRDTGAGGGNAVNLQGIQFETNQSGRLPVELYVAAILQHRDDLVSGRGTPASVAAGSNLNPKYLTALWDALQGGGQSSLLLDQLAARVHAATPEQANELIADILRWQQALWKYNSVGQIGRQYGGTLGPDRWLEPVSPLVTRQDVRMKLEVPPAAQEITLYLAATNAGDGSEGDQVVWESPRLVAPGRADLALRDVRPVVAALAGYREQVSQTAAKCLAAAADANPGVDDAGISSLAALHGVDIKVLTSWLELLGIIGPAPVEGLLHEQRSEISGYPFIRGWVGPDAMSVVANSSDDHVRIPGNMPPHSIGVHPTPTQQVVVRWRSPADATLQISGTVQHAHPECGNGVTWAVELRRGRTTQQLASGIAQGAALNAVGPVADVAVRIGDVIAFVIGPRDGNHSCDLTNIDLTLKSPGQEWNLARDVSPDILAGNPHPDSFGNAAVWNFASEPVGGASQWQIPASSILASWQAAPVSERAALADSLQQLLVADPPVDGPDAALRKLLTSANGPLLSRLRVEDAAQPPASDGEFGIDPGLFGGTNDLVVQAPRVIAIRLPADLADGCEFVTAGRLATGQGSVQLQATTSPPETSELTPAAPVVVAEGSEARGRFEAALDAMRQLFPPVLCYAQIVPVDEVITLNLFYREDDHLRRLMLTDEESSHLDRLWDELLYVSQEPLLLAGAYEQLVEYATQDRPDKVIEFAPLKEPIHNRADAFRQRLVSDEPVQLQKLIEFAERASRRPLTVDESEQLRKLYASLRDQELPHEEAFRLTLARVLVSPEFLYKLEQPGPGVEQRTIDDYELASRLSYFLWSSLPDAELLQAAADGSLHNDDVLLAQTRRLLADPRAQRMAREFAAQWLHVYQFDQLDEKSESHFPTFAELRDDMYEETLLFFADLFQNDRSILNVIDADYTFLNEALAAHYGIPDVTGNEWRRVDGMKQYRRGGILTQAAPLAQQSGASRTSPILRGNWLSEVVLGERLPRPPKGVPVLPETPPEGRTERQLIELHSSDPACAKCHARIDPLGFSLENFDAIGRFRDKDAAGLAIDSRTQLQDGTQLDGLAGLQAYLLEVRRDDFVRQFNRKLLGYALGRALQFSDSPLLDRMDDSLQQREYRVSAVLESIVLSRQFREVRGAEFE